MTDPHALTHDSARPEATAKRHTLGKRTARENIADLCDAGSFMEYGALAIAAQRSRRTLDELKRDTPADGLIGGVGRINGDRFDKAHARCVVMSYDYTVLAGTQGYQNHRKTDRMVDIARRERLPLLFFTEGGGGRPGDTDAALVVNSGLEVTSFYTFARLSGEVPLIGINAGRCFAGNAAFFGCCDIAIATRDANLGMAGPAMIAGGGLGEYAPEDIGPAEEQAAIGVVDILVDDEAEAVATAKRCLSYFQGRMADFQAPDSALLADLMPANRRMTYDVRRIITALADINSVTELGATHAPNLVTTFIRIEGQPLGVIANNPRSLAGAIDSAAARKAAQFIDLCNTHGIALLTLCDTPGIMVGPEAEKTGTVAHASQLFIAGAKVQVPWYGIVLRKAYGLGAQAMLGGHLKRPNFTVAWPQGEFGPMGVEGAVTLGFRRELAAIENEAERAARYQELVDTMYEQGKAENVASYFEIDDVIDPAASRRWLAEALVAR